MTASETEAILTLRLIASFADGDKHGRERQQLKEITLANSFISPPAPASSTVKCPATA